MENNKATKTWNIKVLRSAPSMSQDIVVFQSPTYAEAVQVAHAAFLKTRRSVTLCSGEYGMYFWHRVDGKGIAVDRNTNSGVPKRQQL